MLSLPAKAYDNEAIKEEIVYQQHINNVGTHILNTNMINKKIVFVYDKDDKKNLLNDPTLTKRQIIFYNKYFKHVESNDELAAFLAREISLAVKSYSGEWGGIVSSAQVKAASKKYEIFADKRAVDYIVKAGYNPLGLITLINKTEPNGILGKIRHNTPSKRMATIYEYIYFNYPEFIENNSYISNIHYQNFLLSSSYNRSLLKEKIRTNSKEELKYE